MPTVSAFFSGGVSVGILAGVVSGLFYLVVAGFRWAGRLRAARLREAQRQLQRRRDRERALRKDWAAGFDGDVGGGGRRVAVAAAAMAGEEEERREDGWREVKQHSGEWLYRQVQRRLHPVCEDNCLCSAENGVGMEPKTVQVREFIERLVESLVAGELDNVCIKRLHTHSEYERMFACHHAPLCEALARLSFALQMAIANKYMAGQDSPSAAHAALKQLIHQIIQEAMALPKFKGTRPIEDDVKTMEEMSSKTYEDILATAILNKVIERYQQSDSSRRGSMDGNSNMLSPELMSLIAMHQPQLLHATDSEQQSPKELSDQRFFANDTDTLSELSNTDPLSVTIEECIEEVTTFSNAEEDDDDDDADSGVPGLSVFKKRRAQFPEYGRDIIDGPPLNLSHNGDDDEDDDGEESEEESSLNPTDIINPVDSWEENWLFQKRRLKVGGVQQPMPVPMLVPNPSEDFRALIGDRDAEDVSDLSDCSDGALEDVVHAAEPPAKPAEVLPTSDLDNEESQSVEGSVDGSNLSALEQSGKEPERRSGAIGNPVIVLSEADTDQEIPLEIPDFPEAKNMEFLKSASEDCLSEFGQQEGEYTEDYATVTHQRQMDSLTGMSDVDTQEVPELPSTPIPQVSPETSAADGSIASILDSVVPEDALPQEFSSTDQQERELVKPPRPGTIAEREHKKWETAAPLPNNPYSPENIIKRLNKKHTFVRTNSGSDGSSELPELKDTEVEEKIVEKPLQVICSPSDVDYKRYGRDYYINAEHSSNEKKKRTTSVSSDSQEINTLNNSNQTSQFKNAYDDSSVTQGINNFESKIAIWQKEINQADQYYKNMFNKGQEQPQETPANVLEKQNDSSAFFKSMIKNNNCDNANEDPKAIKRHVKERLQDFEKKEENINQVAMEKCVTEFETKADSKRKTSEINSDLLDVPQNNLGSIIQSYENGIDTYSNGYSRSNSPSGSSILTSDSEFNMPSVKELKKRFSGLPYSESSTPSSKSVSPAPPINRKEKSSSEGNELKKELNGNHSSVSPARPVREIHSLTARSISREFREELRHSHAVPLNKNVYKQINPSHTNGSDSGIIEENSVSSNTSLSSPPKSPVPYRSMQSSIAFWEQMQKNKS